MEKKILIIDDNIADQKLMSEYINHSCPNCIIYACDSGEEGVKKARELLPDIAVIDTRMPDLDGFETCRIIKEIEGGKIKVVMLTGIIDAIDAVKARKMGADDYCVKTFDWVPLIVAVKNLMFE